jgi:hypothetical protein
MALLLSLGLIAGLKPVMAEGTAELAESWH